MVRLGTIFLGLIVLGLFAREQISGSNHSQPHKATATTIAIVPSTTPFAIPNYTPYPLPNRLHPKVEPILDEFYFLWLQDRSGAFIPEFFEKYRDEYMFSIRNHSAEESPGITVLLGYNISTDAPRVRDLQIRIAQMANGGNTGTNTAIIPIEFIYEIADYPFIDEIRLPTTATTPVEASDKVSLRLMEFYNTWVADPESAFQKYRRIYSFYEGRTVRIRAYTLDVESAMIVQATIDQAGGEFVSFGNIEGYDLPREYANAKYEIVGFTPVDLLPQLFAMPEIIYIDLFDSPVNIAPDSATEMTTLHYSGSPYQVGRRAITWTR